MKNITATSVIEIEPFEPDFGYGHIFDVGGGSIFYVQGQEWFPVEEEPAWPNTEFEIVRTETDNLWIGVFCKGKHLVPIKTIPNSHCTEEYFDHESEILVEADLNAFAESLLSPEFRTKSCK